MANNSPTVCLAPTSITDLLQRFGGRWQFAYEAALAVWSGERRSTDDRQIRSFSRHTLADLVGKLTTAELAER